jgi:hypothetical protein
MIGTLVSFMSWILVGMAAVSMIVGIMKTRNLRGMFTSLGLGGVLVMVSLLIPHLTPDEKDRKAGEVGRRLGDELWGGSAPAATSGAASPSPSPSSSSSSVSTTPEGSPSPSTTGGAAHGGEAWDWSWVNYVLGGIVVLLLVAALLWVGSWMVRQVRERVRERREARVNAEAELKKQIEVLKGEPYEQSPEFMFTKGKRTVRL